jgi:chromosome segregation ATPase
MNMRIAFWVVVASLLLTAVLPVQAQDKAAAKSQEQVKRLRQQVQQLQQAQQAVQQTQQQLTQQKTVLDGELKRRAGELGGARKKLQDAERERDELRQKLQAIEQERDALKRSLSETSMKLTSAEQSQRETSGKLRLSESDALALRSSLGAEQAERGRCEANNIALYQHGRELMQMYQDKGVVSSLRQREPMLGLGQVKMENLLEEYRDKLDAQKRKPAAEASAASNVAAGK